MAISQDRYILITSGQGGAAAVGNRELIARIITTNELAPTLGVLEFGGGAATALKNVGAHFGTSSQEYAFASKYFGFISKSVSQPSKISFARYTPEQTSAKLIGVSNASLAQLKAVSDGSMTISMGGVSYGVENLNFSQANSFSDVASSIQTAIRGNVAGGDLWTQATVAYANGFVLTGGAEGKNDIAVATEGSSGTNVAGLVGWDAASSPIVSAGCEAETAVEAMDRIANTSNNFGSFAFLPALDNDGISAVADWTSVQNVDFLFSVMVSADNATEIQALTNGKNGVCLTLGTAGSYAHFMPMAIGACINYEKNDAAVNFMFNQFNAETPSVTTDADADKYDRLKVNYLGSTQQAGKNISFYQRGVLQGDIADIGVYWNEMWLKDAFSTEFMNLLLAMNKLPANSDGSALAKGVMLPIITQAKNAGAILAGKTLTSIQKAYITSLSGDEDAWREVENNGYWLTVSISEYVNSENGLTEYKVDYTLIYAKGDSVKKIVGSDILI